MACIVWLVSANRFLLGSFEDEDDEEVRRRDAKEPEEDDDDWD